MSLTNAISSVSVVAALIVLAITKSGEFKLAMENNPILGNNPGILTLITWLATIAVALAFSNVISGFMITERILRMFKKEKEGGDKK